mgnify:CR=1 FL=1
MIHIFLLDDHPTLRVGLRLLIEQTPDMCIVGEAADAETARAALEADPPDVLMLDCQLPGENGISVARWIRQRELPTRILAFSSFADDAYVYPMIQAGVAGYLLKDELPGDIVQAIRCVAQGQGYFSPSVAGKMATWVQKGHPDGLTEREVEVLRLVGQGASNKEIALHLDISERTAQFHVGNLLRKLGLRGRVEAAVWAREHGL